MAENILPSWTKSLSLTRLFDLLTSVQTPALIWISHDGERIELSGRVFMNWVTKSANLLIHEGDVSEESEVSFAAHVHWRSFVLAYAALLAGASIGRENPLAGVAYTAEQALQLGEPEYVLMVDRAPLSMRYPGDIQAIEDATGAEVLDYSALVRSEADQFLGIPAPESSSVGEGLSAAELMDQVLAQARHHEEHDYRCDSGEAALALVFDNPHGFDAPQQVLASVVQTLGYLAAGYAVVFPDPQARMAAQDLERIFRAERAVYPEPFTP